MNDVVIFRGERFSLEPPLSERGLRYDVPLGDDLAGFLVGVIRSIRSDVRHSPVTREDFGSVVRLTFDLRTYCLTFTWFPDCEYEDRWAIQFSQPVGLFGFLLGRRSRPADCRAAQNLVSDALCRHPDVFTDIEWVSQEEFYKRL